VKLLVKHDILPCLVVQISAPVGGNSLAAMFKKPSGSWECPTCMVQNGATHDVCPACTTPRPGAPSKSADEPVKVGQYKTCCDWMSVCSIDGSRRFFVWIQLCKY